MPRPSKDTVITTNHPTAPILTAGLDTRDPETGQRRLDNPDDFVRIEIKSALNREIPVVPVTFDEATVPKAADVPDELQPLARRNGAPVRRLSFDADVAHLVRGLPIAFDTREASSSSARDGSGAREKTETSEARAAEAARAGRVVAERLFRVELPGVAGWPVPQMVAIPPGRFRMGAPNGEEGSTDAERPQHEVTIDYAFALGQHTVTFAEWDAALSAGAKLERTENEGWGRANRRSCRCPGRIRKPKAFVFQMSPYPAASK